MQTFILFVFRFYLNFPVMIIVLHKLRGIVDECALDRTARFLPRLFFVVELESYYENCLFVNV